MHTTAHMEEMPRSDAGGWYHGCQRKI